MDVNVKERDPVLLPRHRPFQDLQPEVCPDPQPTGEDPHLCVQGEGQREVLRQSLQEEDDR